MTTPNWVRTEPGQTPCVANRDLYLQLSSEEDRTPPRPATQAAKRREAERAELVTYMQLTAKHLCEGCPLYSDCLHEAVTGPPMHGFVAGTTGQERDELRSIMDLTAKSVPDLPGMQGVRMDVEVLDAAIARFPDANNSEIGRIVGCSAHTVGRHRRRRAAEPDTPAVDPRPEPTAADTAAALNLLVETEAA